MALTPIIPSSASRGLLCIPNLSGRAKRTVSQFSGHASLAQISAGTRSFMTNGAGSLYNFMNGIFPAGSTFARASQAWYVEGANYSFNPVMAGTVPGSPGTAPTNWALATSVNGITRTIVGTGLEDGIPYIDVRYAGTPTATTSLSVFAQPSSLSIPATLGQTWVGSWFLRLVGGSLANVVSVRQILSEIQSGGTAVATTLAFVTPTGAALRTQQTSITRTFNNAATISVLNSLSISYANGQAIDLTLRIGLPQLTTSSQVFTPSLVNVGNDIPRPAYDFSGGGYQGMLIEPASTNVFRNNTGLGAVAGSPGTAPTNWVVSGNVTGLSRTIVGSGTDQGIPYVDIRWAGTTTGATNVSIRLEANTFTPAAQNDRWSLSTYVKLVGGSVAGLTNIDIDIQGYDSGGVPTGTFGFTAYVPTASWQRISNAFTLPSATTAFVNGYLRFGYPTATALDFTIRVGGAQLEKQPAATSAIITTNAAGTRAADVLTLPVPDGTYTIDIQRASGITHLTGVVVSGGTGYVVPTDPSPLRNIIATRTA